MPSIEYPNRQETFHKTVEYMNQTFDVQVTLQTGEAGGHQRLNIDASVKQTMSKEFTRNEISGNIPEWNYEGTPFLKDAVITDYSIQMSQLSIESNRIAHRLRPFVHEAVKLALSESWTIWVAGPEEDYDDDQRELADAVKAMRLVFVGNSSSPEFLDILNDWLVANVNFFFRDWECPDGYPECAYFHLDEMEHVQLWTGTWTPKRHTYTYVVEEEEVVVAASAHPSDATWAEYRLEYEVDWCYSCDEPYFLANMQEVGLNEFWCDHCAYHLSYCEECDGAVHADDTFEIEEYDEYDDIMEYRIVCGTCYENHQAGHRRLQLNPYSFKPSPAFHKAEGENTNMFFGLELEVARDRRSDYEPVNRWIRKADHTGLFYCKADSSVNNGFEIVSHPFSYKWAKSKFPYGMFDDLLVLPGILPTHPSAGTHVHLSKDGFTSPGLWKFIQFHLDLADFAGVIGERGATADYGSLKREADVMKGQLKDVAMKKGKGGNLIGMSRSVGINLQPHDTVELRYLAGNVDPNGIRKNIEWVEAVLRFTEMISVPHARTGALKDPGYFLGWLEDQDGFDTLKAFIQTAFPTPKKLEV